MMSSDITPPLEDASALAGLNHQAGVRWLGGWSGSSVIACTAGIHIHDPTLAAPTVCLLYACPQ